MSLTIVAEKRIFRLKRDVQSVSIHRSIFYSATSVTASSPSREIDLSHYAISFIDDLAGAATLGSCFNLKFYLPFKLSNKTPYRRHQSPMRTRHRVPDFPILSQPIIVIHTSPRFVNVRFRSDL